MEDFKPSDCIDGVIPKNEHGNVYLYKDSMMPNGCTLLDKEGLDMKLCKKMEIDCAKAVVRFKWKRGRSYPEYHSGLIVPTYAVEALTLACEERAERLASKERQKEEQKTNRAWKRLVRKMWVRKRLDKTFQKGKEKEREKEKEGDEDEEDLFL